VLFFGRLIWPPCLLVDPTAAPHKSGCCCCLWIAQMATGSPPWKADMEVGAFIYLVGRLDKDKPLPLDMPVRIG